MPKSVGGYTVDDREPLRGFKEGHGQLSKHPEEIRLEGRYISRGKVAEHIEGRECVLEVFKSHISQGDERKTR